MPRGNRALPARAVAELREADAILHGGDFMRVEVLELLQRLGPPVHGVHGNVDDEALRRMLPAARVVELGGARIGMVHDAGPRHGPARAHALPLQGRRRRGLRPQPPPAPRGGRGRLPDLQPRLADRAPLARPRTRWGSPPWRTGACTSSCCRSSLRAGHGPLALLRRHRRLGPDRAPRPARAAAARRRRPHPVRLRRGHPAAAPALGRAAGARRRSSSPTTTSTTGSGSSGSSRRSTCAGASGR